MVKYRGCVNKMMDFADQLSGSNEFLIFRIIFFLQLYAILPLGGEKERSVQKHSGVRPMPRERSLIAVVDDDKAYLEFVSELLAEEGYQTIQAVGDHEAHVMIQREQPDIVILDLRLEHPDSGWQILQMLRLDPATTNIPVIVCSADTKFLREKEPLLRAQRCDLLEKPFDLDMLLEKVRTNLGGTGSKIDE